MLLVKLLCVGRLRERYYREAVEEYRKRLGAFCRFELEELPEERLPEQPSKREIDAALAREAEALTRHIPAGAAVCCFCVEGKAFSSEELAAQLGQWRDGRGSFASSSVPPTAFRRTSNAGRRRA